MSKDRFLAEMAIAYMQNHGHAPENYQLDDWSELYIALERKEE